VRALTSESGTITDTYIYDAFGILVGKTGTSDNAYLYRGEQWDADLGLYYNRARYLNAGSGRFWNADTYEGYDADPVSLHRYLYANADPVAFTDPSGYMSLGEVTAAQNVDANMNRMAVPRAVNTMNRFRQSWCRITEKTIWQAHHLIGLSFGGAGSRATARAADLLKGITVKMSEELHQYYHQLLNQILRMSAGIPGNTSKAKILAMLANGELSPEELKAAMLAATGVIDTGCVAVSGYVPLTPRLMKQFTEQGF
jgi:RHS repeat-associated protein